MSPTFFPTSINYYLHYYLYHTQVENFEHLENVGPKCAQQQQQEQHPHGMNCAIGANPLNNRKLENNETSYLVAVATVTTKEIKMVIVKPEKTPSVKITVFKQIHTLGYVFEKKNPTLTP